MEAKRKPRPKTGRASRKPFCNVPDDICCHCVAEAVVSVCLMDTCRPVIGKSLKAFALFRSHLSHSAIWLNECGFSSSCRVSAIAGTDAIHDVPCVTVSAFVIFERECLIALWKSEAEVSFDRKYFWSGCSSKIADEEYSFSVLGEPMTAVENLPLNIVPQSIQRTEDSEEGSSFVMEEESFDVFKEEQAGLFGFCNAAEVEEELPSRVIKAELLSCD